MNAVLPLVVVVAVVVVVVVVLVFGVNYFELSAVEVIPDD
jgi:hypothetical protein